MSGQSSNLSIKEAKMLQERIQCKGGSRKSEKKSSKK